MLVRRVVVWCLATAGLAACASRGTPLQRPMPLPPRAELVNIMVESNRIRPPVTRRDDTFVDLFGTRVADPYQWLEHSDDPAVARWVAEQNHHTTTLLSSVPGKALLQARLEQLLTIGEISLPSVRRTGPRSPHRYFHTRRAGEQDQPVLYVRDGLDGEDRVLVDPNALSREGTVALDWYVPSVEGGLLAYGLSEGGSEESTLYLMDVTKGERKPDTITRARYSSVCFVPGGKRFFYSRFPAPGSVPAGEERYHRRIYEHVMGRSADADPLVFAAADMTDFPSCTISPDGRWLVIRVHQGWSKSQVLIGDTRAPKIAFREITGDQAHIYDPLVLDDALFVRTNEGAPRYALYRVDPAAPERKNWKQVVPEHATDVLADFNVVAGEIFVSYLSDAVSRLERFSLEGKPIGEVPLSTLGTNVGVSGLHDGDEAFYDFESFASPPVVRRLETKTGATSVFSRVEAPVADDDFVVVRGRARSRDGTTVPYLAVHSKAVTLGSGDAPTLLYGYGGFNVSLQPRFSRTSIAWLERGGVYVQANLRGGGEFGEDWHRAGQLEKKQNVFDDFIAVGEDLVAKKITRPERLAIYGRSNGGLLVAAVITQRPDLFRAAVSSVPLTDMLRYEQFLIARLWASEYGSASNPEQAKWLLAYSPYHRVQQGTAYPAVLLTTAEGDTRVDPMHARKMAAALQHATTSGRPVLLRSETAAGHGQGKPVSKIAEEYAELYGFVGWQLGMDLTQTGPGAGSGK